MQIPKQYERLGGSIPLESSCWTLSGSEQHIASSMEESSPGALRLSARPPPDLPLTSPRPPPDLTQTHRCRSKTEPALEDTPPHVPVCFAVAARPNAFLCQSKWNRDKERNTPAAFRTQIHPRRFSSDKDRRESDPRYRIPLRYVRGRYRKQMGI